MPLAILIAVALQSAPAGESELSEMRSAYAQDCLQRDYGSFDDICNQLADQISAYARSHPDAGPRAPSAPAERPEPSPERRKPPRVLP